MSNDSKKVYIGLSGGVDSSVSASLLKDQGYDVTGVFIKIWHPDFLNCTWKEDMRDAMRVCAKLDIPFKTIDLSKEYEDEVIKYMIKEYSEGRTPNPDVMCNKYIKFGLFYDFAIKDGADFVATGHYAKTQNGLMYKAKDQNKDQTYFLWTIPHEKLKKVIFPIGDLEKSKVREIAEKKDLVTAFKKDSQGLCFVGHIDMKDFLKNYLDSKKGAVLSESGDVIGEHDGSIFYTTGQRHGFTILEKGTEDKPMYVISKNLEKNTITVSENKPKNKGDSGVIKLSNLNIIDKNFLDNYEVEVRFRYRQDLKKAELKIDGDNGEIKMLEESEKSHIGQSAVFYKGDQCLGGGVITN